MAFTALLALLIVQKIYLESSNCLGKLYFAKKNFINIQKTFNESLKEIKISPNFRQLKLDAINQAMEVYHESLTVEEENRRILEFILDGPMELIRNEYIFMKRIMNQLRNLHVTADDLLDGIYDFEVNEFEGVKVVCYNLAEKDRNGCPSVLKANRPIRINLPNILNNFNTERNLINRIAPYRYNYRAAVNEFHTNRNENQINNQGRNFGERENEVVFREGLNRVEIGNEDRDDFNINRRRRRERNQDSVCLQFCENKRRRTG